MALKNEKKQPELPELPGLDKLKKDYLTPPKSPDELLRSLHEERLDTFRDAVKDIEEQIIQRQRLHGEIMTDLDAVKSSIRENLPLELQRELLIASARDPETFRVLGEVLRQQAELDMLRVREKLDEWRDIAKLKEEFRERKQQLREAEGKAGILEEILS